MQKYRELPYLNASKRGFSNESLDDINKSPSSSIVAYMPPKDYMRNRRPFVGKARYARLHESSSLSKKTNDNSQVPEVGQNKLLLNEESAQEITIDEKLAR